MQYVPNFPPKGVKVDFDKLEDEILLFEIANIIINLKQHKEKEKIMKFRNDQHRSTFLKEAKNQSQADYCLLFADSGLIKNKVFTLTCNAMLIKRKELAAVITIKNCDYCK